MYNVSKAQDTSMIATMLLKLSLSDTTHLNRESHSKTIM